MILRQTQKYSCNHLRKIVHFEEKWGEYTDFIFSAVTTPSLGPPQEYMPPTGGTAHEETWRVSSMPELLRVHKNFLSGKVRLLLASAAACHRDGS